MEEVRETLLQYLTGLRHHIQTRPRQAWAGVGVVVGGLLLWKIVPDLRRRSFAWLAYKTHSLRQEDYENFKNEAFTVLKEMKPQDPKLGEEKSLRILEIGAGVGANFSMYPDNTRLIVVDPNPYFEKYFFKNKEKFSNIKIESVIVAKGEDIDGVESNSCDAVVTTLVLCSVTDIAKVVSQIKRVLVPGGKYIFVEHVQEWDKKNHGIRRFIQSFMSHTGIWPSLFDGCLLNRNPLPIIEAVGFSNVFMEQLYAPMPVKYMELASPHLRGVATK